MLLIPIEETKQHVSIMFTLKSHQVIMGVQLPEIQSLSLFLGSGFLLIWGFSSLKSSHWVCSWAQGFSWHGGSAPGNLVFEFVLGLRVSPDMGVQILEIRSLSLFLGSGFLLTWGFSSWKSGRWVCSWVQGFSWHGAHVRELVRPSQSSCSGIMCGDSPALSWWQSGDESVGNLAVKCGRCQQNIKHFEGKQV